MTFSHSIALRLVCGLVLEILFHMRRFEALAVKT